MSIDRYVNHPVKVSMLFLALVLLGWLSWRRLPLNLFPDVQTPRISVVLDTGGLDPREGERRLTADLERQLSSIKGVSGITSYSRDGSIAVLVDFHWGSDMELAYLDVKRNVGVFETREEVVSVDVYRFDPNAAPLMTIAFTGEVDRMRATSFIENTLRPRLETVKGVAHVKANGAQRGEVRVELDEDLMTGYRLTAEQVMNAITQHNMSSAGGAVLEGGEQMILKFVSRFRTVDEIGQCVVTVLDGHPIHLSEIGHLTVDSSEDEVIVHQDGQLTVALDVFREPDANAVETARGVREVIDGFNARGAHSLKIAVDQSREIERAIDALVRAAGWGMLLAMVVLLVFLRNPLATLVAGLAIPISIIATFNLMYFQGLSLNLMTLGGLALGAGMLVDNAIVVIENVFRHRAEGAPARRAAVEATREVGAAIVAATITTVVVFVPLIYVHGIAGILFRDQALTVIYSLSLSLLVALILIPMLAARIPGTAVARAGWITRAYGGSLRVSLGVRWLLVAGFAWIMFVSLEQLRTLPTEFFPEATGERLSMTLDMPPGTPLERTVEAVSSLESQLLEMRYRDPLVGPLVEAWQQGGGDTNLNLNLLKNELARLAANRPEHPIIDRLGEALLPRPGEPPDLVAIDEILDSQIVLKSLTTTVGTEKGDVLSADERIHGSHTARMDLVLNERNLAELSAADLTAPVRAISERIPGLEVNFESRDEYLQQLLGRTRGDLVIEVHADRLPDLQAAAETGQRCFELLPELQGARTNLVWGEDQYVLYPDDDALLRSGIGIEQISAQVEAYLSGNRTETLKLDQGEMAIALVRENEERGLAGLMGLEILDPEGEGSEPLVNLVRMERLRSVREVMRVGQERTLLVMADLAPGARYDQTLEKVRTLLDAAPWPAGATWNTSVEESRRRESFDRLLFALLVAVVLVYMVIAAILESVIHPLTIMLSVPFALVGVVAAFKLTGSSVNLMGLIGIVMLAGIVVNNAIVLLDRIRQIRSEGTEARQAVVEAARQRLRPIVMTSLTTMLALAPLALGIGAGVELRRPLALSVIGGLASSTVLTLLILPALYLCVEDVLGMLARLLRMGRRAPREVAGVEPEN